MEIVFYRQIFEKYRNIEFYKNPSTGNAVDPYRRKDGQTDMMKLTVYFRHSAKASKKKRQIGTINTSIT
jgi:hypothetical protein